MRNPFTVRRFGLMTGISAIALLASPAHAEDATTPSTTKTGIAEGSDIVVTATRINEIAPTTASLEAKQPQSIVSRSLIEDSLPATADFDQIALITPSVSNFNGNNGVGLSESKAQIRGFQDGEFNITYDGVPFGDTNDPTHHSTTFFPSNTIETLVVDRGPGNASQLGQATFGGNINLFSRAARDEFGGQVKASYGSFNTYLLRGLLNTGNLGGDGIKAVVTGQYVHTDGALSYEKYRNYNLFGKIVVPLGTDVKLTFLGTYNNNRFNQPDKDGSTLFQQAQFGKDFSLNADPKTPQYFGYNHTDKTTDFEIATLEAHIAPGSVLTNQAYTYYYDNETLSALDVTGATANTTTLADGKTKVVGDVPGYTKTNKYRVYGDIMKLRLKLTDFATVTTGAWLEWSRTYRQQTDVDLNTGGFNYIEKKVTNPVTGALTPLYVKFDQNSQGNHTEEFVELELRPVPALTITPGFKHVDFGRKIIAAYNQTTRYAQTVTGDYKANLPFVQANWAITPMLSAYAEYARGFLAPPLGALYVANPQFSNLEPERSTNYQAGVVYHGERLSFDFDAYHIKFTNKFVSFSSPVAGVGTVFTNIGGAVYKGVEGQVAFALTPNIAVFANGSINSAKASDTGLQIAQAPKSTAAGGVIVKQGPFKFSVIDKFTGPQSATGDGNPVYDIKSYNTAIIAASYEFGPFRAGIEVTDAFGSRRVTQIAPNSKTVAASAGLPLANNFDQYYYQPGRAVTGDITVVF
ncbi:TonB-dependent receptor [Novosphingobium lentum]|uniref:TonB-dependent receptor n=1 Tax=Novosphingobium lentum TaxID=145287 RepID=UPI0008312E62|nr:TonB-dependent receptor [Novosphingobium lentum]